MSEVIIRIIDAHLKDFTFALKYTLLLVKRVSWCSHGNTLMHAKNLHTVTGN